RRCWTSACGWARQPAPRWPCPSCGRHWPATPEWPPSLRLASRIAMRDLLADLSAATGLLTRLPTGWLPQHQDAAGFARSIWAYPLVGFGIGAWGGAVLAGGLWLG